MWYPRGGLDGLRDSDSEKCQNIPTMGHSWMSESPGSTPTFMTKFNVRIPQGQ